MDLGVEDKFAVTPFAGCGDGGEHERSPDSCAPPLAEHRDASDSTRSEETCRSHGPPFGSGKEMDGNGIVLVDFLLF